MPYATPTSPLPSPSREPTSSRGRWAFMNEDKAGPSTSTGPMPGIPRRTSSNTPSPSITPRRAVSPPMSRSTSASHQPFAIPGSRPTDGLPRRASEDTPSSRQVSGLPATNTIDGTLGLRLHPSPSRTRPSGSPPIMQRGNKDSMSSTSTMDSSLPATPQDEPFELPSHPYLEVRGAPLTTKEMPRLSNGHGPAVPFPTFEPSLKPHHHSRARTFSPIRPVLTRNASGSAHRGTGTGSLQIEFPPHAPSSRASRSTQIAQSLRPTAAMIRKKSGEVVKSSLKQRSMSTPDLTRQPESEPSSPGESRPFGEERSKSVRFAGSDDAEDGHLENVVVFMREQKVTAVSKALEGQDGYTETETENDQDNDTDASDFVEFRTRRNESARLIDEMANVQLHGGSRVPRVRTDFGPDTRGLLRNEHVILERVELQPDAPLALKGTALVRNISFQKWVTVRFTLDHWQTVSEVACTHVTHIPSATTQDEGWDRFSFTIKLEDYRRKLDERVLMLCIRFSVDGHEWWDSNNGLNYQFSFKKAERRRPVRHSGPTGMAGGFLRLNDPNHSTLPGLKQRTVSPASEISRAFGVTAPAQPTGPRNWTFPKLAAEHLSTNTLPPRSESPALSPPPPASFRAPGPPDVHNHLSLSKYCAPSPPTSPPKESSIPMPIVSSPTDLATEEPPKSPMAVVGGQLATLTPSHSTSTSHERRSSWNGDSSSWDSFAKVFEHSETETETETEHGSHRSSGSTDGEATPVANRARSPVVDRESSDESSPENERPALGMKRSTHDLQALLKEDSGVLTPPSSNLSSPPSPSPQVLPQFASPSMSLTSTGESSPINTVSSDSELDTGDMAGTVDTPMGRGKQFSNSYQEFLDRFCFFQPPAMTSDEGVPYSTQKAYVHSSGTASPVGFPFFSNASNSPIGTPVPGIQNRQDRSSGFDWSGAKTGSPQQGTPRPSPPAAYSPARFGLPSFPPAPTPPETRA